MASKDSENPPKYEDIHSSTTTGNTAGTSNTPAATSSGPWSGIQSMIETAGIGDAARRVSGAGDYFRHTILANVERLAGDAALADEKEQLAAKGYEQMMRGRTSEPAENPSVTEYYAPDGRSVDAKNESAIDDDDEVPGTTGEKHVRRGSF